MKHIIAEKATATATLLISADPDARLRPKPEYQSEFEISEQGYDQLPPIFTFTELPQPAVVAAECIKDYPRYLAAISPEERPEFDLEVGDRWSDEDAVRRFINKSLAIAFDGEHFTVSDSLEHIQIEGLYLDIPSYSFAIADGAGQTLDFYSAPGGFDQPIAIEARVNVMRPVMAAGF